MAHDSITRLEQRLTTTEENYQKHLDDCLTNRGEMRVVVQNLSSDIKHLDNKLDNVNAERNRQHASNLKLLVSTLSGVLLLLLSGLGAVAYAVLEKVMK